jgi:hypothetical protein
MATMEAALEQCQSILGQLLQSGPEKYIASPVLKDFKLCVDGLRLTLWALIQSQEENFMERKGASMDLAGKLVEFRTKRLIQMLEDLQQDINRGRLSPGGAELAPLSEALRSALQDVERLAV